MTKIRVIINRAVISRCIMMNVQLQVSHYVLVGLWVYYRVKYFKYDALLTKIREY